MIPPAEEAYEQIHPPDYLFPQLNPDHSDA
jgi:hypothetical protein